MKAQVGLYSWGNEYFSSGVEAEVQTTSDWNEENPPTINNNRDQFISHTLSARPWGVPPTCKIFSTPSYPPPLAILAPSEVENGFERDGPIASTRISVLLVYKEGS